MSFHFLRHRKYNNCLGGNEFWDEVGFTCKAYLDYMRKKFNLLGDATASPPSNVLHQVILPRTKYMQL